MDVLECGACFDRAVVNGRCTTCGVVAPPPPAPPVTYAVLPPATGSLADARAELMRRLDEGTVCQCCGQYAKRYRRKLSALMARWLIALVRLSPNGEWVHAHDVFAALGKRGSNASDYCYLERWGMIEPAPPDAVTVRPELKPGRSGHWRPTEVGRRFVAGAIQVSSVVVMYGARLEGFEGGMVTVQQALAKKFVYEELMRGNYGAA